MRDVDAAELRARYLERYREFGVDRRTLGWNKDCQGARFAAAIEQCSADDLRAVLDVGCGFGDLLAFLRQRGWTGSYFGIDLVPELITEARLLHRDDRKAQFEAGDLAAWNADFKPSAAIAIGLFNHRLHQDNLAFASETIDQMWGLASHVVVCDFLSTASDVAARRDDLYYADPSAMLTLGQSYSRRALLHHAYMPFEFMLKIWHDDAFSVARPVFAPYT